MPTILAAALMSLAPAAQDPVPTAEAVLAKHLETINAIKGVVAVSTGGTKENRQILIRVDSAEAKELVRNRLGERLDGYKIFIYVAAAVGQTKVDKKPPPPPTREKEKEPEPEPTVEDCDVIRDHLGLKKVHRTFQKKTIPGCRLMHRQRIGGGGGHSFWYTRHRYDCPIRTNKLGKPKDVDEFVAWVFDLGFLPAKEGSFLLFELKGSDNLWFDQVKKDLTDLLPYIREGAKWVKAPKKSKGFGWKWQAPKPSESESK